MKRNIVSIIHRLAGGVALLVLMIFWLSTVANELSGNWDMIRHVKIAIPRGFVILIPALIMTGASGFRLSGKSTHTAIVHKKRRMKWVALNGLFVLIPCSLILQCLALENQWGVLFTTVQIIELIAGAVNITLIVLNIKAGMAIKRRKNHKMPS